MSVSELLDTLDRLVWSSDPAGESAPSLEAIAQRLYPSAAGGSLGTPERSVPEGSRTVPILAADRIDELRSNLPPETFANLVEECLVDMDHRLPALRRALVAGAPGAAAAHAHALVGMAAGYGMAAMEARLRTIMAVARAGDMAPLGPATISALETDFAETASTLRTMLRREVV